MALDFGIAELAAEEIEALRFIEKWQAERLAKAEKAKIGTARGHQHGGRAAWGEIRWGFVLDVIEDEQVMLRRADAFELANDFGQIDLEFQTKLAGQPLSASSSRTGRASSVASTVIFPLTYGGTRSGRQLMKQKR